MRSTRCKRGSAALFRKYVVRTASKSTRSSSFTACTMRQAGRWAACCTEHCAALERRVTGASKRTTLFGTFSNDLSNTVAEALSAEELIAGR